ncbi:uncharacterized protein LOC110808048 [Carica papaya]|uniref:uncharacterized protein LOC110808048 n=1 Tax=Carica papaya TaxID=3649 RepID=UPI000B8C7781|nr:uncharacterized protein LOC110808048 [Carica papaya]
MEDWHGVRRSMRDGDFEEEDVWSYGKERENSNPPMRKYRNSSVSSSSSSSSSWSFKSTAPRMIPNGGTHEQRFMFQQSSAPVNIPDWSKIYGKSFHHMGRNGSSCVHDHGDDGGGK